MIKHNFKIQGIPAILWGEKSDKLFIAVHGNMSNKADDSIIVFAEETAAKDYQVLSFDLPDHGDRKDKSYSCKVQNCVKDLSIIMNYAKSMWSSISIFACSMGAYFTLLTYKHELLKQCLFLSPVVNMELIINNMMTCFNITEDNLKLEKQICTPIGQTLYWDYYCYVKEHPVDMWDTPTSILYGSEDSLCKFAVISSFAKRFNCNLEVMEHGEHYFHTKEQLKYFRQWLKYYVR